MRFLCASLAIFAFINSNTSFAQSSNPLKQLRSWTGNAEVVKYNGRDYSTGLPCEVMVRWNKVDAKLNMNLYVFSQGVVGTEMPVAVFEGEQALQKARVEISNGFKKFSAELNQYKNFKMIYNFEIVADSRSLLTQATIKSTHYFLGAIPRTKIRTCEDLVRK
ncbi:MAG TPA: hypothetical protein VNJ01_10000 [Bacteriovoracaceae bacterium]|nr:hypothetical protein [Bacteriovoracaceae bacterium]